MATVKESPSLKLATNGFILEWTEYSTSDKKDSKSVYSSREYLGSQQQVFTLDQKEKAMEAFIKLGKECGYKIMDSEEQEEE